MGSCDAVGFGYAKALIFGEYAVMYGAPGLAVALSPKLHVKLSDIRLSAELGQSSAHHALLDALNAACRPNISASVEIQNREFFDADDNKYGIGSSAATVVALTQAHAQALYPLAGIQLSQDDALKLAIRVHRVMQNGLGSGLDILASALGGGILAHHCPDDPQITRIDPNNLPPFAFFTMHMRASTLPYISAAERVKSSHKGCKALSELKTACHDLSQMAIHAKKNDFIERIAAMPALLQKWQDCIGLPILPPKFELMHNIASNHRVVLKTSGAGGGDLLLAFAKNINQINNLNDELQNSGIAISRLSFDTAPMRKYP